MSQPDAFALSQSNLNGFLFADIGVERSGMPLSVISALAREGLDPWQEAERLAKQPRTVATDALARLIAALPASLWPLPDATVIAARLVALLPGPGARDGDAPVAKPTPVAKLEASKSGPWLIVAILTVTVLAAFATVVAPKLGVSAAHPAAAAAPATSVPVGD